MDLENEELKKCNDNDFDNYLDTDLDKDYSIFLFYGS